jgi:hypothetical protein
MRTVSIPFDPRILKKRFEASTCLDFVKRRTICIEVASARLIYETSRLTSINLWYGSSVGIATDYGLADQGVGVRVRVGSRILTSSYCPGKLWGTHILLSNGYWGSLSLGVKQPGREADS